jgi:hypothetical protein
MGKIPAVGLCCLVALGLVILSCSDKGNSVTGPTVIGDADTPSGISNTGGLPVLTEGTVMGQTPNEEFNCTNLQEWFVRFTEPGYVRGNVVGLFYNYVGAPAGAKKLEIYWDEENEPTTTQIVLLGMGEVRRDDDSLSDYRGIIEHAYPGITEPTRKRVRVNLIAEGKTGNCATVRRVEVEPGSEDGFNFTTRSSLTTLFGPNDARAAGNMFDIDARVPMRITGFDVNLDPAGTTNTIEVYYRLGTVVGHDTSAAGWVFLGSDTVVSAGRDNPTRIEVGGATLVPGRTYGFYVTLNPWTAGFAGTNMRYTMGGPTVYQNADLSLTTYYGKSGPVFSGTTWGLRQWNGTVRYVR